MVARRHSHSDRIAGAVNGHGAPKSVLVADDHPMFRDGLRRLLARDPGLSCCGEADTVADARRLATDLRPDLVLIGGDLPGDDCLAFVAELRSVPDAPKVVVLCCRRDPGGRDVEALRRGASAFVSKRTRGNELLRIIRESLGGQTYFGPEMIARLVKRRGRLGGNGT